MVKEEAKNVDDLETDEDDIHPPPPQPKALVTANNSKGSRFAKPTASRAKPVIPNKIVTVKSGAATVKRNSVVSNVSDPPPPAIDTLSQSSSNGDLIAEEVEDDPIITDVIITIEPPPPPPLPPSSETTTAIVVGHRKSWKIERIPSSLVEKMSLARAALPVLPTSFAWLCFALNFCLPGSGTMVAGLLGCCIGAPRFSSLVTAEHRILALVINLTVGFFQFLSVVFCLVGWCWSLGWGIILVKTAGFYNNWDKRKSIIDDQQRF